MKTMEHTEILDEVFVEALSDAEKNMNENISKKRKSASYFKVGIYSLLLGFLAFQSFQMMQVSAVVRDTSLDVEKENLYQYEEVLFEDVEF